MRNLALLDYIQSNPNWEHDLSNPPYSLTIKREGEFVMFSYSQIESDFGWPMVQEARGIIFHEPTWIPVCVPFTKFFNWGEPNAAQLDWNSAKVTEKVDGSIIKVWEFMGNWYVSTNNTIFAQNAPLATDVIPEIQTFYDLFMVAANNAGLDISKLDSDYTHMFELTSPYNKVVISYPEISITHIGSRNKLTGEEEDLYIGVKKPLSYNLKTLEDCIAVAKEFPFNQEGFVVSDKYYNRIKIKSPQYVAAHHLVNNNVITYKRLVDLIVANEGDEFLNYFPEYESAYSKTFRAIYNWLADAILAITKAMFWRYENPNATKKDFALTIKDNPYKSLLFLWYDGKINPEELKEWLFAKPSEKILEIVGFEE